MTRNLMFGLSLLTLTGTTAFAAPAATHHSKAKVVAEAPAADAPAPASDKPAKKPAKHTKKAKGETKSEMKSDAPSGAKTPAPETTKTK